MTTKYFKFDMLNETIIASAANIKKAGDPATEQYKELCAMKKAQPTFKVEVKAITKNKKKNTWSGLTIEAMETFVLSQKNNAKELEEFNTLKKNASYPTVKSWFLSNYKDIYKKAENKKAMTKNKIYLITSKAATPALSKVG